MQQISVGVDSHRSTLAAAAIDPIGRVLGVLEVDNDPRGHQGLLDWSRQLQGQVRIGIESSGNYGACLARTLIAEGEDVYEVPPNLSHREARRRARGKSDATDAVAIARVLAREKSLPRPRAGQANEDLKLLVDHFDHLKRHRNQLVNRIHKALVVSHPGYEKKLGELKAERHKKTVVNLVRGDRSVRGDLVRFNVRELRRVESEMKGARARMGEFLVERVTSLTDIAGIGTLTAARLLGEVGDVTNFRSKAAFAVLTGTAPIPASSGLTVRHRLSRHGNRRLNFTIHYIALTRLRVDPDTKAFMAKKMAEGKSWKEALRSLKRHISNLIYRTMLADARVLDMAA
jgi:transposase